MLKFIEIPFNKWQWNPSLKPLLFCFSFILNVGFFEGNIYAQDFANISITGVLTGNESNDAIFKATSPSVPSLAYIRAQRIDGPQNGLFTQSGDNIRYFAISNVDGIPANLSKIRFSFLASDRRTPVVLTDVRFIINDIDGPNNEALATNCDANVHYIGTANPTNLIVDNTPPDLNAVGSVNEEDGPTSRVMFEFTNVSIVEFDNYANDGYLKDFDLNNDYPIATPVYVECIKINEINNESVNSNLLNNDATFVKIDEKLMIKTEPIYFDTDKFEIRPDAAKELDKVVFIMKSNETIKIELGSYTDSRASDEYNLWLSEQRAIATVNYIVSKGIDANRILGKGYGETDLVNECENEVPCSEEQHQLNRRTEFVIVNPEVLEIKNASN